MTTPNLLHGEVTSAVIGACFEVYKHLGYGFLEHVYVRAMEIELRETGHSVARELSVPVFDKGHEVATQRLDLVVDGRVVVEVKSTEKLPAIATRQVFSYLRGTNLHVGLVLHFGPEKGNFRRVVCDANHKPGRPSERSVSSVASVDSVHSVTPSS